MISPMENILILGGDTRSFLSCVRSYGKRGYTIHVAECHNPLLQKSKFIKEFLSFPDFYSNPDAWCDELNQWIVRYQYLLILPVDDSSALKMKAYLKRYPDCPSKVYLLDDPAAEIVNDKWKTYELARKVDVPVADYVVARSESDIRSFIQKHGYPFVLKPFSSFTYQNLDKKNFVEIIHSEQEYEKREDFVQKQLDLFDGILVQQYFEGVGAGIEFLAHDGKILCAFEHIRIHEPLDKTGGSSYRKSVKLDPALLAATERLVGALHYTGVGMAEYRLHLPTNTFVLIEINGRFWGSLPLAIACGMDFPANLLEMLVHQKRDFSAQYRENYYCKNLQMDHRWTMQALKRKGVAFVLAEFFKSLGRKITFRETFDERFRGDNAIFWAVVRQNLKSWISKPFCNPWTRKIRQKCLLSKRPPVDHVSSHNKVLFVCYGNICRSAFADRYRKSRTGLEDFTRSCGYYFKYGRPANKNVRRIAKEKYGLDFSGFASTKLDEELMEWADYVVCFDDKNYSYLTKHYRKHKHKVVLLGAFDQSRTFIADPYWSDESVFDQTLSRIASLIDRYLID